MNVFLTRVADFFPHVWQLIDIRFIFCDSTIDCFSTRTKWPNMHPMKATAGTWKYLPTRKRRTHLQKHQFWGCSTSVCIYLGIIHWSEVLLVGWLVHISAFLEPGLELMENATLEAGNVWGSCTNFEVKHFWCTLPESNIFAPANGGLEYVLLSFWGKRPIFRGKLAVSFREGREYFQQKQNGSSEVLAKKQLLKEWLRGGLTTKKQVFYDHFHPETWGGTMNWAMKKNPGCWGYRGFNILPSYVGLTINKPMK